MAKVGKRLPAHFHIDKLAATSLQRGVKMTTKRGLFALACAFALAMPLSACKSEEQATPGLPGAGKTLNVLVSANSIYPTQQKQWFGDVAAKFKTQTGADVTFETFASPNDELTKIQTSVLSSQGPDVYSLGTTFTPTAYATGAF